MGIENVLEKRGRRGEHASRGDGYGNRGEVRGAGREGGAGRRGRGQRGGYRG